MADEQESVVLVAIARAASKYSPDEGFGLPVKRRLNYSAIAAETRRDRLSRSTKHLERSRPLRLPGS